VAVSTFKAETYRHFGLARPTKEELAEGAMFPPGTVHLPDWVESERNRLYRSARCAEKPANGPLQGTVAAPSGREL